MQLKTKKIVAREGLVLLTVFLLVGAALLFNNYYSSEKSNLTDYGKIWKATANDTGIVYLLPAKTQEILEERLDEVANSTTQETKDAWIQNKYGKEIETINLRKKYESYINYSNKLLLFFLFALYPIYLILRFIVWAVCTLKKDT